MEQNLATDLGPHGVSVMISETRHASTYAHMSQEPEQGHHDPPIFMACVSARRLLNGLGLLSLRAIEGAVSNLLSRDGRPCSL